MSLERLDLEGADRWKYEPEVLLRNLREAYAALDTLMKAAGIAASQLEDYKNGWPEGELFEPLQATIDRLHAVLGE